MLSPPPPKIDKISSAFSYNFKLALTIGDRFTAICTYGGTKTSSYVTGYVTKANYVGEVHRTGVSVIRYTVVYTGTTIEPEVPEEPAAVDEPISVHWAVVTVPAAILALAAGGGGTYLFMKRKERTFHEEIVDDGNH